MREIGLVGGASLTDILNDNKAWQASAYSINKLLVNATWVVTYTLHKIFIVRIARLASAANSIDGDVACHTVAVKSVDVEDLVGPATIAVWLITIADLDGCWLAPTGRVAARIALIVGIYSHC